MSPSLINTRTQLLHALFTLIDDPKSTICRRKSSIILMPCPQHLLYTPYKIYSAMLLTTNEKKC